MYKYNLKEKLYLIIIFRKKKEKIKETQNYKLKKQIYGFSNIDW